MLQVDVYNDMLVADVVQRATMDKNLAKYRVYVTSSRSELDMNANASLLSISRHMSIDEHDEPSSKGRGHLFIHNFVLSPEHVTVDPPQLYDFVFCTVK